MKKIDFGKLAVDNLKQEEIIAWLSNALTQQTATMLDGLSSGNIGIVGAAISQLSTITGVAQALDEKVNGKKEPTVV